MQFSTGENFKAFEASLLRKNACALNGNKIQEMRWTWPTSRYLLGKLQEYPCNFGDCSRSQESKDPKGSQN